MNNNDTGDKMNTTYRRTFDDMMNDEAWLGFGYLGARYNADPDEEPLVDQMLDYVMRDWTDAERFTWANSKPGRHFGDVVFGGTGSLAERFQEAERFGLVAKVVE